MKYTHSLAAILCGSLLFTRLGHAATAPQIKLRKQTGYIETLIDLTPEGVKLEAAYTAMLESLREDLKKQIPVIDDAKKAALMASLQAELGSQKELAGLDKSLRNSRVREDQYNSLVEKLRSTPGWITEAEKKLKAAQALPDSDPKKAKAVEQATKNLENLNKNLIKLPNDVAKAKAAFDNAAADQAALMKSLEAANQASAKVKAETKKLLGTFGVEPLLSSDQLDAKLIKFVVLKEGQPRFLAQYAQQSPEKKKRLDDLLADTALMREMLLADGAHWGKYGEAMDIYHAIQQASTKAKEGVLHRLAIAVCLEHAVPMASRPRDGVIVMIDPIKRYLSMEKAYLAGEYEPAFKDFSIWELRMVCDGDEPDEAYDWAREMMRTYRPDLIALDFNDLRYTQVVDAEIQYTSAFVPEDKPELLFMQNVLANGGICGRRAFFGRFILKAFGIPAIERPEPGHATLAQWTPDGWMTILGGDWGGRARVDYYGSDMHFVLAAQARENATEFVKVKRAQWIGQVMNEPVIFGMRDEKNPPQFWYALAAAVQDGIADGKKPHVKNPFKKPAPTQEAPAAERAVTVDGSGVITIPAVATKIPADNVAFAAWGSHPAVIFMPSHLGGMQLHYSRYGGSQVLEYAFEAPKAGKYELTSRMASSRWDMSFLVSANGSAPVSLAIPYKMGLWETSKPIMIDLKAGTNVLTFARPEDMRKGVAIKDFTLKPIP